MPSLADSAFIFVMALLLFGPKKLPELARQLGKLMGEFRRASNEFRMQMEDELRISEQEEQRQKIAALEAAAPPSALPAPEPTPPAEAENTTDSGYPTPSIASAEPAEPVEPAAPLPIATSGDLNLMPPATGLPISRSANGASAHTSEAATLDPMLESIPHTADPEAHPHA